MSVSSCLDLNESHQQAIVIPIFGHELDMSRHLPVQKVIKHFLSIRFCHYNEVPSSSTPVRCLGRFILNC